MKNPSADEGRLQAVAKLQGSPTEALDAMEAALKRLDLLGAMIRRYSASSLNSRVKAFAENHDDEEYRQLARNIVSFKYQSASPLLLDQLAGSMADRRQRLRYIRQHQQKIATRDDQESRPRKQTEPRHLSSPLDSIDEKPSETKKRKEVIRKQMFSQPRGKMRSKETDTTPDTNAWTFKPTQSAIERVKGDGSGSVVSSSKASTTRMTDGPDDYPKAPSRERWRLDPKCPICWRQLQESELRGGKWRLVENRNWIISDKCN